MADDTTPFTRRLVADLTPVQPLPNPWMRAAIWCAVSLPVVAAILFAMSRSTPLAWAQVDRHVAVQQLAALLTGVTAAAAAFATTVPGSRRWILLFPLVPLAVWLGDLGQACVQEAIASGSPSSSSILEHWGCLPATAAAGAVPAAAIVAMLRRGVPLTPRLTTVFAAVAASGLGNFLVRFVHAADASLVVLLWHFTAVFVLSGLSASAGRGLFNWRQLAGDFRSV